MRKNLLAATTSAVVAAGLVQVRQTANLDVLALRQQLGPLSKQWARNDKPLY
jgi:hypothetical protein